MRKFLFFLVTAAAILVACNGEDDSAIPSGLTIKGTVDYAGAMVPVAEGVWDVYGRFKNGQITVADVAGREFLSFRVPAQKEGLCRLRVKSDRSYSLVRIDRISLVVTDGGVEKPRVGSKPPIEAVYRGGGVWGVTKLLVATDHMRYRFLLETDSPEELRYLCPTWDDAGSQPTSYSGDYLKVRPLGQEEYDALGLLDNYACWMFPESETDRMAAFTLSMNDTAQKLDVAFSTSHLGPRAVFMGDSIIRHWGSTSPRELEKAEIVIPMDPMPSWMRDDGDNVTVFWHPEFFSDNDYISAGISGNTTAQMLARYRSDALTPDPQCIVIMGGTNDLSNGQPEADIFGNIQSMAQQAEALGIKVILCSVTPCNHSHSGLTNPQTKGAHIIELNRMIREYAEGKGILHCDFHSLLVDTDGLSLQNRYRLYDDLHPNPDAYTLMEGLIKPMIDSITE